MKGVDHLGLKRIITLPGKKSEPQVSPSVKWPFFRTRDNKHSLQTSDLIENRSCFVCKPINTIFDKLPNAINY